jgi:hypothetical protein
MQDAKIFRLNDWVDTEIIPGTNIALLEIAAANRLLREGKIRDTDDVAFTVLPN